MPFKVNKLRNLAIHYRDHVTDERVVRAINITKEFFEHAYVELKNDKKINWNCNAQVRDGKSTFLIKVMVILLRLMRKLKQTKEEPGVKNILRDEQELSEVYKDGKIYRTIRVVDEWKEIDATGLNATTEQAFSRTMSDQYAGKYIHTLRARPRGITDINADINLIIWSVDYEEGKTMALVYYRLTEGNNTDWVLIGHIIVSVKDLIKKWTEIKTNFENLKKETTTKKDIEKLRNARKEDFYVDYQLRKYEAMDMLTKNGYLRIRDAIQETYILEIVDGLMDLLKVRRKSIKKELIKNEVKEAEKRNKMVLSILGRNEVIDEVITILNLWKDYFEIIDEISLNEYKFQEGKIEQRKYIINETRLTKAQKIIGHKIGKIVMQKEKAKEVVKEYMKIESGEQTKI